jgi:hypothetical protein
VIKILEDFLDEARRGEIVAGAIVLVRPNVTICTAISLPTAAGIISSPHALSETRHHRRDGQLTFVTTPEESGLNEPAFAGEAARS